MKILQKIILVTNTILMFGCQKSINSALESNYIEERQGITYYKGNVFDGELFTEYKNGNHKEEVFYEDGKAINWKWYKEDGTLEVEGIKVELRTVGLEDYENGVIDIVVDENGLEFFTYDKSPFNGKIFFYWRNSNDINRILTIVDGYFEGVNSIYTQDNELLLEEEFKKGLRNGKRIVYYYNSKKPEITQTYKNGVIDGESITYNSDGSVANKANFKNGEYDGEVTEYYKDGTIKGSGLKVLNGDEDYKLGGWSYWKSNGELDYVEEYDEFGDLISKNYFYENGNIKHIDYFNPKYSQYKSVDYDEDGEYLSVTLF